MIDHATGIGTARPVAVPPLAVVPAPSGGGVHARLSAKRQVW